MESTLYVDPSYTCTGLFLHEEGESLIFSDITVPHEPMKTYARYYETAHKYAREFEKFLRFDIPFPTRLCIEVPPPIGQASAGLWGLSFLLVRTFQSLTDFPVFLIPPQFLFNAFKKAFPDFYKGKGKKPKQDRPRAANWVVQQELSPMLGKGFECISEDDEKIMASDNVYSVYNIERLSNGDTATAFLFWYFEQKLKKEFIRLGE